ITLIVAPAGYGKSVALGQYLSRIETPFARFAARSEHASLLGFVHGLAQSFPTRAPRLERGLFDVYQASINGADLAEALAVWFAAHLGQSAVTVVVDDLHVAIGNASVLRFTLALIARSPKLTWILSSRTAVDLPVATWLAYGQADNPIDEDILRIRPDEAIDIARACRVNLSARRLAKLLAMTGGWPAAFIFGLRAAAPELKAPRVFARTSEALYAYLADQVFFALAQREKRFLLETALLSAVDLDVLAAAGWGYLYETYADLRRHADFITPESATVFRYHDLFRAFLIHRLRAQGTQVFHSALCAAADLEEAAGRMEAALRLRTEADDKEGITRMLRAESTARSITLDLDAIEAALTLLPDAQRASDAALIGLLARIRAFRGQWEESDALHRAAIELATDPDQRAIFSLMYDVSLFGRSRKAEALAVLAALDVRGISNIETRARVLCHLAVHHARTGDVDAAERYSAQALEITAAADAPTRAHALYNAGFLSFHLERAAETRERMAEALAIAERCGDSAREVVFRCHHVLQQLAFNDGNWNEVRGHLSAMFAEAQRLGSAAEMDIATSEWLRFETLAGNRALIKELDARFEAEYPEFGSNASRALERSMRAAWAGDFGSAQRIFQAETEDGDSDADDIVWTMSHLALYAAGAGDRVTAVATLESAAAASTELVATGGDTGPVATEALIANAIAAVAHAQLGESRTSAGLLAHIGQARSAIPAVRALAVAARTFNRLMQGAAGRDEFHADLDAVRAAGLGGYANLLAALPLAVARHGTNFAKLTKAELQMLRLIARGDSTQKIAAEIGRSPETVGSHVHAILRKLGCKRRSEAIALAREHGIV
ncbi:MAG: LuxR C-terminal-related transcriptional regulator, partial [Vulcanimicrobiaceae bacterium]